MTREEKIAIMQAHVDGKQIEVKEKGTTEWRDVQRNPYWNWLDNEYSIKSEQEKPIYRPYTNFAEFRADWDKHGGWVISKRSGIHSILSLFSIPGSEDLVTNFTWADDGSPCGILEEGGEL